MLTESLELDFLCENIAFYLEKIYIEQFCTAFDRPQLSASEEWCIFIGHEYRCIILLSYLIQSRFVDYLNEINTT